MKKDNRIIDVHHHILPPQYLAKLADVGITESLGKPFPFWSVDESLNAMNRNFIDYAVTSISSPGVSFDDPVFSRELSRICNEYAAGLKKNQPDRFGYFASLPLPDIEGSMVEAAYALDVLNADGIILMSNYNGKYLGDNCYDELFSELNNRGTVIYVHPTDPPGENPLGKSVPNFLMEVTFDTTRTVASLIYGGVARKYPNLSFIFSHAGGTVPYLAWRLSLGIFVIPGASEENPIDAMKGFYFDTALAANKYALSSLLTLVEPSQVLFGSDYPFAPEIIMTESVKELNQSDYFEHEDLKKVYAGNADLLFNL